MISLLLFYIVRNLFYTIGDLTYQSPLVILSFHNNQCAVSTVRLKVICALFTVCNQNLYKTGAE
jgi:hypothetical protein